MVWTRSSSLRDLLPTNMILGQGRPKRVCAVRVNMNLGRTVFSQLVDFLPTYQFQICVNRYQVDDASKISSVPAPARRLFQQQERHLCPQLKNDRKPVCAGIHAPMRRSIYEVPAEL